MPFLHITHLLSSKVCACASSASSASAINAIKCNRIYSYCYCAVIDWRAQAESSMPHNVESTQQQSVGVVATHLRHFPHSGMNSIDKYDVVIVGVAVNSGTPSPFTTETENITTTSHTHTSRTSTMERIRTSFIFLVWLLLLLIAMYQNAKLFPRKFNASGNRHMQHTHTAMLQPSRICSCYYEDTQVGKTPGADSRRTLPLLLWKLNQTNCVQ